MKKYEFKLTIEWDSNQYIAVLADSELLNCLIGVGQTPLEAFNDFNEVFEEIRQHYMDDQDENNYTGMALKELKFFQEFSK